MAATVWTVVCAGGCGRRLETSNLVDFWFAPPKCPECKERDDA